jgi:hypothetical protein
MYREENVVKTGMTFLLIASFLLTACTISGSADPIPTQPAPNFQDIISTATAAAVPTSVFATPTATPLPSAARAVCTDPAVAVLLDSLKAAMLNADGALLGSLVSPNGMEVRYFRDGTVVTYSPYQAGFLFETTYQADWGSDPASGIEKTGSFHDVVVPAMVKVFNQPYTLHCNEIRHGGATYEVKWPYSKDFYSIHFAGTQANGFLDWHTWVVGVEYSDNKPYVYALMQFFWEP